MENKSTELIDLRNKVIQSIIKSNFDGIPDLRDGNKKIFIIQF